MSNRKTKKQKIQAEQRRAKDRKSQIKGLQELREKAIQLEKRISEQKIENFKQLNIRNLRVFGNTCNFIAPFVISAGLTVEHLDYLAVDCHFIRMKLLNIKHTI